jgi:hypothetical protein
LVSLVQLTFPSFDALQTFQKHHAQLHIASFEQLLLLLKPQPVLKMAKQFNTRYYHASDKPSFLHRRVLAKEWQDVG